MTELPAHGGEPFPMHQMSETLDLWGVRLEIPSETGIRLDMTDASLLVPSCQEDIFRAVAAVPVWSAFDESMTGAVQECQERAAAFKSELASIITRASWWLQTDEARRRDGLEPFADQLPKDAFKLVDTERDVDVDVLNYGLFPLEQEQAEMLAGCLKAMIGRIGPDFTRYIRRIVYRQDEGATRELGIGWDTQTVVLSEFMIRSDAMQLAHQALAEALEKAIYEHMDQVGDTSSLLEAELDITVLLGATINPDDRYAFVRETPRYAGFLIPRGIYL